MAGEARAVDVALWIGGLCSLVTTVLLNAHDPVSRDAFGDQHLALSGVCLVPLGLAAGALVRRRVLLLPAAVVALLVGPVLWSGLPLLWVPAIAYAVAFARRGASRLPWWRAVPAVALPILLGSASLVLLFSNTSESCAQDAGRGACAYVPPTWQLIVAAALALAAVVLGWVLARPQAKGEISPRNPHVVGLVPHRQSQAE